MPVIHPIQNDFFEFCSFGSSLIETQPLSGAFHENSWDLKRPNSIIKTRLLKEFLLRIIFSIPGVNLISRMYLKTFV